jgi:hypothetical protein
VENNVERRAVYFETVLAEEPQLSEPVHEEPDPRVRCADRLGQTFLPDLEPSLLSLTHADYCLGWSILTSPLAYFR